MKISLVFCVMRFYTLPYIYDFQKTKKKKEIRNKRKKNRRRRYL